MSRSGRGAIALVMALSLLTHSACASSPASEVRLLSLDEKIGQLFVVEGEGTFMNEKSPAFRRLLRHVSEDRVGGIIWYGADVYETAWANDRLQAAAKIPLLISADLESGVGMRFDNTTFWPWPMAVAATGDPRNAELEGRIVAGEARTLGINQIYAPVADVNNNPDNPVINVRSYGEDPDDVARFVSAFIRGVQSECVLATVKHFPGHGDTRTDSHRALPAIDTSRERLERVELVPFRAAITEGVASVMLAHLSIPRIDATGTPKVDGRAGENPYSASETEINLEASLPTSLSPAFVEGMLRGELGFDGLVVTDALDMGGITDHFDPGEAAVRAIDAGADQILKSADTGRAIRAIKQAVLSGRLSMDRIDQSVGRILAAKRRIREATFDADEIFRTIDTPEHRAAAEEIAAKAVTLVREEPGALPLSADAKVVELVVGDFPEAVTPLADFRRELRARLSIAPTRFALDRRSRPDDEASILDAARDADVILVVFTVRTRSGAGSVAVPAVAKDLIRAFAAEGKRVIGISFGNPYLLREVPTIDTYIAAWGIQPVMQAAVARAIFGEAPVSGRLPVTIPGIALRGDGIVKARSVE